MLRELRKTCNKAQRSRQQRPRTAFTNGLAALARPDNERQLRNLRTRQSLVSTLNAAKEKIDGELSQGQIGKQAQRGRVSM